MSVEDVRLNTPRKTSGAVASTGKTPLEQLAELPSFVIPNVKEAFEKEKADLRSLKLVAGAAADIEKYRKRYAEFRAKTGKVTVGNLIGGSADLIALQKAVSDELSI
jgi:hypothetical protein